MVFKWVHLCIYCSFQGHNPGINDSEPPQQNYLLASFRGLAVVGASIDVEVGSLSRFGRPLCGNIFSSIGQQGDINVFRPSMLYRGLEYYSTVTKAI